MEIVYDPYKKVSFRTYLQFGSPEELVSAIALSVPASVPAQATLRWANGILLSVSPLAQSDIVSRENVAGHVIWDHVDFAFMEEFRASIPLPEKPMVLINVLDVSKHPLYGPFCEWIKKNLLAKGKRVIRS